MIFVLGIFCTSCQKEEQTVDTKEGLSILEEMEQQDVAAAEQKISETRDLAKKEQMQNIQLTEEEIVSMNYRDVFSDSVLLGDSITSEIVEYGYLDADNVFCKTGISMVSADEYIEKAKAVNPKIVFLNYGSNDMDTYQYNEDLFRNACRNLLEKAVAAFPDAQIYVNSIFPVKDKVIARDPWREETAAYNQIYQEVCQEYGVTFLDNTQVVKEEYYAPDGMHFNPVMYPHWLYSMAKGAGLL